MTTADLIKELKKIPQDAELYLENDEGYDNCLIEKLTLYTKHTTEGAKALIVFNYVFTKRSFSCY